MIRTVRRVQLLTVLALLCAGLLQPLAAAQGVTCARKRVPVSMPQQVHAAAAQGATADPADPWQDSLTLAADPSTAPQPDAPRALAAPCGSAALPAQRNHLYHALMARHFPPLGDLLPASVLIGALFRPPRLS